jgi:hypothetical protein
MREVNIWRHQNDKGLRIGRLRNGWGKIRIYGIYFCFCRQISFNNFARYDMSLKFIRRQSETIEIRYHKLN